MKCQKMKKYNYLWLKIKQIEIKFKTCTMTEAK